MAVGSTIGMAAETPLEWPLVMEWVWPLGTVMEGDIVGWFVF